MPFNAQHVTTLFLGCRLARTLYARQCKASVTNVIGRTYHESGLTESRLADSRLKDTRLTDSRLMNGLHASRTHFSCQTPQSVSINVPLTLQRNGMACVTQKMKGYIARPTPHGPHASRIHSQGKAIRDNIYRLAPPHPPRHG